MRLIGIKLESSYFDKLSMRTYGAYPEFLVVSLSKDEADPPRSGGGISPDADDLSGTVRPGQGPMRLVH